MMIFKLLRKPLDNWNSIGRFYFSIFDGLYNNSNYILYVSNLKEIIELDELSEFIKMF